MADPPLDMSRRPEIRRVVEPVTVVQICSPSRGTTMNRTLLLVLLLLLMISAGPPADAGRVADWWQKWGSRDPQTNVLRKNFLIFLKKKDLHDKIRKIGYADTPIWDFSKGVVETIPLTSAFLLIEDLAESQVKALARYVAAENMRESGNAQLDMIVEPHVIGAKHSAGSVFPPVKIYFVGKDALRAKEKIYLKIDKAHNSENWDSEDCPHAIKRVPMCCSTIFEAQTCERRIPPFYCSGCWSDRHKGKKSRKARTELEKRKGRKLTRETNFYLAVFHPRYEAVAEKLLRNERLDPAFHAANSVIGAYGPHARTIEHKIPLKLVDIGDRKSGARGYSLGSKSGMILLGVESSEFDDFSLKEYCRTLAHETAHTLFSRSTPYGKKGTSETENTHYSYLTEALARYVAEFEYADGQFHGDSARYEGVIRSELRWRGVKELRSWSPKQSWDNAGREYILKASGETEALFGVRQLAAIGYFLAGPRAGYTAHKKIHKLIRTFNSVSSVDEAFREVFGKPSGQSDPRVGVDTLYSEYYCFWFRDDAKECMQESGKAKDESPRNEIATEGDTSTQEPTASMGWRERRCRRKWKEGWSGMWLMGPPPPPKKRDRFWLWACVQSALCSEQLDRSARTDKDYKTFERCLDRITHKVIQKQLRDHDTALRSRGSP